MSGEIEVGRELDREIAEKVFGYEYDPEDGTWRSGERGKLEYFDELLPAYSTRIAAAWSVVSKVTANDGSGWDYHVQIESHEHGWLCQVVSRDQELAAGEGIFETIAATPAEAICRAALEAVK